MSGLAQVFLTDHELETLVRWGDEAAERNRALDDDERRLFRKLLGISRTVSCRACATVAGAEGESCPTPTRAVTPGDVRQN